LIAGLVALIVAGARFSRLLRDLPHPRGARRVLLGVTALGAAGIAAVGLRFGAPRGSQAAWLVVAVPVLWTIPLWILLALEPRPEPPLPRVIVSR
jgi:hypothetical protein